MVRCEGSGELTQECYDNCGCCTNCDNCVYCGQYFMEEIAPEHDREEGPVGTRQVNDDWN